MPLPGSTIVIPDTNPLKGTITDLEGYFMLEDVPTGRISLQVNYLGYRPVNLDNLNVISGKELIVNVEMEENVIAGEEIVIKAHVDKTKPLNKMSTTSARTFSVEESQRYAGARNDVARMAADYGNAMSGVFDLRLRDGNYDKYEFLGQVGINGFEIGAEGPISRKNSIKAGFEFTNMGFSFHDSVLVAAEERFITYFEKEK